MDASLDKRVDTSSGGDEGNRRGDILRAAGRLFREKGYNGTTIRDIAAAVNMRSGSPFYHFKTKHDMLLAIVLEGIQAIHDHVAAATVGKDDPVLRAKAMIAAHVQALLEPQGRDFAAVTLHECACLEPAALLQMQEKKDAYEALWATVLAEVAASGKLAGDLHITRLLILGAMNWSTAWYNPAGRCRPEDIAAQLSLLIFGTRS